MRTVAPSGTAWQGALARRIADFNAATTSYFVSVCTRRSGAIATSSPSCNSQRASRPSAQARNSSTVINGLATVDMVGRVPHPCIAGKLAPSIAKPAKLRCCARRSPTAMPIEPARNDRRFTEASPRSPLRTSTTPLPLRREALEKDPRHALRMVFNHLVRQLVEHARAKPQAPLALRHGDEQRGNLERIVVECDVPL